MCRERAWGAGARQGHSGKEQQLTSEASLQVVPVWTWTPHELAAVPAPEAQSVSRPVKE